MRVASTPVTSWARPGWVLFSSPASPTTIFLQAQDKSQPWGGGRLLRALGSLHSGSVGLECAGRGDRCFLYALPEGWKEPRQ